MENLTRNNYEIWFVDYLDGQLGNEQLEVLLDFLEQNPDLKQELLGISGFSLEAGTESLDRKEFLLKSPVDIPGIAAIDQLCIARMENDLSEEDARLFDLRLEKDIELGEKYAAFQRTRLDPADTLVYPFKKELLRKTRILSPWLITAIASAAVVLLAWILWPDPQETVTPPLAKIENPAAETQVPVAVNPSSVTATRNPLTDNLNKRRIDKQRPTVTNVNIKPVAVESGTREFVPMHSLSRRIVIIGPRIPDPQSVRLLFASVNQSGMTSPFTAEPVLTLPQYALQLFREKILGEDHLLVRRTRFSLWEVAGAGVNKINTLAGTEMKLNREYDSKGDLLAVSFNSRLVDVESPVKASGSR
jgi:hypothetical protein